MDNLRARVAVIGSGPGGAVTACLLAEAGLDVLLLEEGRALPQESCLPFSLNEMEQKYRHGGVSTIFGPNRIAYVEGKCVGGGSEINSGLYHRTSGEVLERWRDEFALQDAGEEEMRPHFAGCERDLQVAYSPEPTPEASLRLRDGAARLGWSAIEVPRWYLPRSAGVNQRNSMSRTYIKRALNAGCRLFSETKAERLRQDDKGWTILGRSRRGGRNQDFKARAESVFVCGGAIQTPLLLRRSGLRRNVGNSLQIHPTVKLVARFPHEVNLENSAVPGHQVKQFAPHLSFGCSISSRPFLALGLLGFEREIARLPETWKRMAVYYAAISPQGIGTVRSVWGHRDALVRYRLTAADYDVLTCGAKRLCELMLAAGAEKLFLGLPGVPPLASLEDLGRAPLERAVRASDLVTVHLFSSCPMGEDRRKCATDSYGRVHGVNGLYIADASLLCSAPGVNPQGSIMAFARRNACRFLAS